MFALLLPRVKKKMRFSWTSQVDVHIETGAENAPSHIVLARKVGFRGQEKERKRKIASFKIN